MAGRIRILLGFLTAGWLAVLPASAADDAVHIAGGEEGRGRTVIRGEVLDYTGRSLLIRLPGAVDRSFPGERVVRIDTIRVAEHQAADKLRAEGQFEQALAQYRLALEKEERRWVRREILAQMTRSARDGGDYAAAGQFFLLLVQSDPDTPYFDTIPLTWLPGEPSPALEQLARQWLAQEQSPVAVLLGASHLLSTAERGGAAQRLQTLSFHADARLAWLARAQLWRETFATASRPQVEAWATDVEKIPEPLRAGGYFVLGRALARWGEHERAALAYLRVPILYGDERALSARALLEAGRELERIGQKREAATLYREVLSRAKTAAAAEAQQRLEALAEGRP